MSEKVLGFYKRKGYYDDSESFMKELKGGRSIQMNGYLVREDNIVPVRLASESVELKALKEYCGNSRRKIWSETFDGEKQIPFIDMNDLLLWAEKEAKKQAGEK